MIAKKTPLAPLLHLNGSAAKVLLEQQQDIYDAALKLESALAQATPHDRDYYLIDSGAGAAARKEHLARIVAVRKILEDTRSLMTHIRNSPCWPCLRGM